MVQIYFCHEFHPQKHNMLFTVTQIYGTFSKKLGNNANEAMCDGKRNTHSVEIGQYRGSPIKDVTVLIIS